MSEYADISICQQTNVTGGALPVSPSPWDFLKTIASDNNEFVSAISKSPTVWRYPYYMEWMRVKGFIGGVARGTESSWGKFCRWLARPFVRIAKSSFIEWRYYSLISKDFHGIVGVCLFNPECSFSLVAEGGLLVIVAGVASGSAFADSSSQAASDLCWMKLFPTETLVVSESKGARMECIHDGVHLEMINSHDGTSQLSINGNRAPNIRLQVSPVDNSTLPPVTGRDVSRIPGAHWTVHNVAPMAKTSGVASFGDDLLSSLPNKIGSSSGFVSCRESFARPLSLDGAGYYEHSFGVNPMPFHGWDFCFVPNPFEGNSLVMQTYRNSKKLKYVDVHWTQDGKIRHQHFDSASINVVWEKSVRSSDMKVVVPETRVIKASSSGYALEVRNHVSRRIPFLRREKLLVRHYYISEEIGKTSWILRSPTGEILCNVVDHPSGGETASRRIFV